MIITAITAQKHDQTRCNLFLNGRFSFSLPLEVALKHHLKVTQELSEAEVNQLVAENDFTRWYDRCLNLISRRPRSEKEISDYLHKHEVGGETKKLVTQKLIERKFIDDTAFAQWFIEQRHTFRPKGKRLLALELKQKGIAGDLAQDASYMPPDEELQTALTLVQKKMAFWQKLPLLEQKKKIQGFLARRGYDWEIIGQVLHSLTARR